MDKAYKKLLKKLRNLIVITLLIYLALGTYSAVDILKQGAATSFPWWSGFIMGICYLIPILIVEIVAYVFTKKSFYNSIINNNELEEMKK